MIADAHGRTPLPKGLAIFRQALRYVGRVELAVAVMSFTAVVVLNLTQITLRLFDSSIWWAQEVSLLLAMIAYFIGVSCVFRLRQFVRDQFLCSAVFTAHAGRPLRVGPGADHRLLRDHI